MYLIKVPGEPDQPFWVTRDKSSQIIHDTGAWVGGWHHGEGLADNVWLARCDEQHKVLLGLRGCTIERNLSEAARESAAVKVAAFLQTLTPMERSEGNVLELIAEGLNI